MLNLGLVLSGGGARGAYQAGVLAAISEVATRNGLENPFPLLTGVSAGSINAAIVAGFPGNFAKSARLDGWKWSTPIDHRRVFGGSRRCRSDVRASRRRRQPSACDRSMD